MDNFYKPNFTDISGDSDFDLETDIVRFRTSEYGYIEIKVCDRVLEVRSSDRRLCITPAFSNSVYISESEHK